MPLQLQSSGSSQPEVFQDTDLGQFRVHPVTGLSSLWFMLFINDGWLITMDRGMREALVSVFLSCLTSVSELQELFGFFQAILKFFNNILDLLRSFVDIRKQLNFQAFRHFLKSKKAYLRGWSLLNVVLLVIPRIEIDESMLCTAPRKS